MKARLSRINYWTWKKSEGELEVYHSSLSPTVIIRRKPKNYDKVTEYINTRDIEELNWLITSLSELRDTIEKDGE